MTATLFDKHAKALVGLVSEGLSLRDACDQRGLRYKTAQSWLGQGRREPDGRYGAFTRAVEEARAKPVQDNKPPGEVYQATRLTLLGLQLGPEHELGKAQALALAEMIDELRHTKGGAAATGAAKLSERLEQVMAKLPLPRTPTGLDYLVAKRRARLAGEDTAPIDRAYAALKASDGAPSDSNGAAA
jgi:hypothetical protein